MIFLKSKIKNLIYFFLNFVTGNLRNEASILMYHSVSDTDFLFNVLPKDFTWQMKYLYDNNFNVISYAKLVETLKNKEEIPHKAVVLTFDDGFSDNYDTVLPVLKKYNFPATIFLTTNFVNNYFFIEKFNKKFKMLTWEQVEEMERSGLVDFQLHTTSHLKLSQINKNEIEKEITESKKIIDEKLSKDSKLFAYPFGVYNEDVIEILKENNFDSAVTVMSGLVNKNSDLCVLPRNFVYLYCGRSEFKGLIKKTVSFFNFLK
ncbi:polysaccharide deacetylase family protein [Patescibacteria group bacterium]